MLLVLIRSASIFILFLHKNICSEALRLDTSNEYQQHMFKFVEK